MNRKIRSSSRRRPVRLLAAAAFLLAPAALVACGDDDADTASADGGLTIEDPWARTSAGSQANGAAYMVITGGDEDDRLVAASVPTEVAASTEVHETVAADGESEMEMEGSEGESEMEMEGSEGDMEGMAGMTMREVEGIDIPAGGTVNLEPGGYHIMMLDLTEPLENGQTFELTLTFEMAGEQTVTVEVREA